MNDTTANGCRRPSAKPTRKTRRTKMSHSNYPAAFSAVMTRVEALISRFKEGLQEIEDPARCAEASATLGVLSLMAGQASACAARPMPA